MPFRPATRVYRVCSILVLIFWPVGSVLAGSRSPRGDVGEALRAYYRGDYTEAARHYQEALGQSPANVSLAGDLAAVLAEDLHFAEAAQVLEKAGIAGEWLGELKMAAGDIDGALAALRKVLQQPGDHSRTRLLMGFLSERRGQQAYAVEHYWRALEDNPRQSAVRLQLARAFVSMGESISQEKDYFRERAREEYAAALKADRSLWQVQWDLARLAEQEKKWAEAYRRYNHVRSVVGDAEEVRADIARVEAVMPAPTARPTPAAVLASASPPGVVFEDLSVEPVARPEDPVIRVGLARALSGLAFGCTGEWRARDHAGRQIWKGLANTGYRVERHPTGGWVLKRWDGGALKSFKKKISLESIDPRRVMVVLNGSHSDGYWWSTRGRGTHYYRGVLEVKPERRSLRLVNLVSLEEYLLSVIPGEMPASWPMEALKSQAVVARTDTLLRRGTHRKQGFDVCTSAHCAVYRGVKVEHPRSFEALVATRGEVLLDDNKLLPTFYHHACGGMTQGYQEAWGEASWDPEKTTGVYDAVSTSGESRSLPLYPGELPAWLEKFPEVFCANPQYSGRHSFRWIKIMTQEEMSAILNRRYGVGRVLSLQVLERSRSGYVRAVDAMGDAGRVTFRKDAIRSSLGGLRSNLFSILPIRENIGSPPIAWLIWGAGWGHGVGLCQAGAGEMAEQGYRYPEILRHYFPQGEIAPWP